MKKEKRDPLKTPEAVAGGHKAKDGRAPVLVGCCGKLKTGKSTCARILEEALGAKEVMCARKLKAVTAIIFDWPLDVLMADTPELRAAREELPPRTLCGKTYTPRTAMEFLGTDLFRTHMGSSIWVECMEQEVRAHLAAGHNVVVSDARFTNEIDALQAMGATLVMLHRTPDDLVKKDGEHPSNNEFLDRHEALTSLPNTGTIDDLRRDLLTQLQKQLEKA